MKSPSFKQWDHLEPADRARRIEIVAEKLAHERSLERLPYEGMNAHAVFAVAAHLDGDDQLAQEYLNVAVPYSQANTRYATWIKFRRIEKPFDALLALAQKPDLLNDTKQLLANDLFLTEEQQLRLIQETNPQLVGDVGANPCATPKAMEAVSNFKNVIARVRLAENPGLSIELMEKLVADKRQAQAALAKNWMIPDEIRQKLFETLDPEVILTLALRQETDKSTSLRFAELSIAKHKAATDFDMKGRVDNLKLWLMEQPETPLETWLPFLDSADSKVTAKAISKLPVGHPGLEDILEANLNTYLVKEAVLTHPGLTDKLVDRVFNETESRFRLQPLINPHISEKSVLKLLEHAESLIEIDFRDSRDRFQGTYLPEGSDYAAFVMYGYLNAGGQFHRERMQASIARIEAESKRDLNPATPRAPHPAYQESNTEAEIGARRHPDLGYQDPSISPEWLLKNVKNRTDEIKKDVLLNPSLTEEAMRLFALDKKPEIRKALAFLPNCPDDIKALVALQ